MKRGNILKKKNNYKQEIQNEIQHISKEARSKVFGVVYSRTAIILLLVLFQAAFFSVALNYLESYGTLMYALASVASACVVI